MASLTCSVQQREPSAAEQARLIRDGVVSCAGFAVSGLAGLVLVPFLFRGLSSELYGVWIAALALETSANFLNAGVGRGVVRDVAGARGQGRPSPSSHFLSTAAWTCLLLGCAGGLAIGFLGLPISSGLRLSAEARSLSRTVFALFGVAFFGDQVLALATEVISGHRRFVLISLLTVSAATVRTAGLILLLASGFSIVALAFWHGVTAVVFGGIAWLLAMHLEPRFRLRPLRPRWELLRSQVGFSAASQLADAFTALLWRSGPFLIGLLRGSAAIVPYEIGYRLPNQLGQITWQAAGVMFPAASEYEAAGNKFRTRRVLIFGTRYTAFVALPSFLFLAVLAPHLIAVWIHAPVPSAAFVLRLIALAMLADTLAAASIQVLWGQGKMRSIVALTAMAALANVVITVLLLRAYGAIAAAIGLCLPVSIAAISYVRLAAGWCHVGVSRLARLTLPGPMLAGLSSAALLALLCKLHPPRSWAELGAVVILGGFVYLATFFLAGTHARERNAVKVGLARFAGAARPYYRALRRLLDRVPALRGPILLAAEIKVWLLDSSERDRAHVEHLFQQRVDPYEFAREPERFQRAAELLDSVSEGKRFQRALEIGCAEGLFTEQLSQRCEALLAVDFSPTALARTRERCGRATHICCAEWDVRSDAIPGRFDLVVAVGVLEYIRRPRTLKRAGDRIVNALAPGGYLLLGNSVADNGVETRWWAKALLRGTWINRYMARDPRLEIITSTWDQYICPFEHVLLRRRED